MSERRQLPLFSEQPMLPEDINRRTALRDTLALFQAHLIAEGKTAHTVTSFTSDLALLAEYSGESTPVGMYTTRLLDEFMTWIEHGRGVPCSRKSYARRVTTLKVYFKWLHEIGALPDDPAKPLLQRSGSAPLSTVLDDDQIADCIGYAERLRAGEKPDVRPLFLFRLLLDTGVKKGEAMGIAPEHIDRANLDAPTLFVKAGGAKDKYKERRIVLPSDFPALLDAYLAQYTPPAAIFNCTPRNLEYILEAVGRGAGVAHKLSFENMRWTSAVRDYRNGVDPDAIRDKLGLSDVSWYETFGKIRRLAAGVWDAGDQAED